MKWTTTNICCAVSVPPIKNNQIITAELLNAALEPSVPFMAGQTLTAEVLNDALGLTGELPEPWATYYRKLLRIHRIKATAILQDAYKRNDASELEEEIALWELGK